MAAKKKTPKTKVRMRQHLADKDLETPNAGNIHGGTGGTKVTTEMYIEKPKLDIKYAG